jgi:hypothetical protein
MWFYLETIHIPVDRWWSGVNAGRPGYRQARLAASVLRTSRKTDETMRRRERAVGFRAFVSRDGRPDSRRHTPGEFDAMKVTKSVRNGSLSGPALVAAGMHGLGSALYRTPS